MKQRRGLSGEHREGDTVSDGRWLKAGTEEHGLWRGEWTAGDTKDDKSPKTMKERPRELIALRPAEQSGEEQRKSRRLYAAADEMIRCRCGDCPGGLAGGS